MPSSEDYKRDYKQEAKTAKRRGEQGTGSEAGSAKRHRARRKLLKEGKVSKNQHVHHRQKIKDGGTNASSNLAAVSPSVNLRDNGHSPRPRNHKAGLRRG